MIDQKEHFYSDNPEDGHPDVRTKLEACCYFFLGNGLIKAAVQFNPAGPGTPVGLLIMDADSLGRKRDGLTMDRRNGLEPTMLRLVMDEGEESPATTLTEADWDSSSDSPVVEVQWHTEACRVTERFFCHPNRPEVIREIHLTNRRDSPLVLTLRTGIPGKVLEIPVAIDGHGSMVTVFSYTLHRSGKAVRFDHEPGSGPLSTKVSAGRPATEFHFNHPLLDHFYRASTFQLPAVISRSGIVDGGIWQYNHEWVRDQTAMAWGLLLSGRHELARVMLHRLLTDFVSAEGDTIDSGVSRDPDEVELDQNGELLLALEQYCCWTGDMTLIGENWPKCKKVADYPLKACFRHEPSGLLFNRREYWERHRIHGIQPGMELTSQLFTSLGLSAAARMAAQLGMNGDAERWKKTAAELKAATLSPETGLISGGRFIKRRGLDGAVQRSIEAMSGAGLPETVPLAGPGEHLLDPDTATALPVAFGFIDPGSALAKSTLDALEVLWDQAWDTGGYGRYHISSEPDSPGGWAFASLFMARAFVESGDFEKMWRVLRWLDSVPCGRAGSWFEYYGERAAPPFPQVGIPPWTWAEILLLLVHHIAGLRPGLAHLRIRPRLPDQVESLYGKVRMKGGNCDLTIMRSSSHRKAEFRSSHTVLEQNGQEALINYQGGDIQIEAVI